MKKNAYLIMALFLGLAACDSEPKFLVEGEVNGAESQTLYFEESSLEGIVTLDSMKLKENGTFRFTQKRPEAPEFYRIRLNNNVINFAVDSTETVKIKANASDFPIGYTIEGSNSNKKIKELVLLQSELQTKVNQLSQNRDIPAGILQENINTLVNEYKDHVKKNYIFAEPNEPYAYFALFQTLNGYLIYNPLSDKEDIKCFAAVATSLNNAYPHSDRSKNLYNMVIKGMKNTRPPKVEEINVSEDKISETSLINIELKGVNNQVYNLTDLKGKVVLLDFTVYNNAMSPAHNLALRELYNKYASKGLEIYQVSLDGDEHFWKTQADNLPWICVRDTNGIYSTYVSLYGVNNLPALFLINKDNELRKRYDADSQVDIEKDIQSML